MHSVSQDPSSFVNCEIRTRVLKAVYAGVKGKGSGTRSSMTLSDLLQVTQHLRPLCFPHKMGA